MIHCQLQPFSKSENGSEYLGTAVPDGWVPNAISKQSIQPGASTLAAQLLKIVIEIHLVNTIAVKILVRCAHIV